MNRIAIVGCGGVNSWSVKYVAELLDTFYDRNETLIELYDGDEVEEKNLLRSNQNFTVEDLFCNKATALAERYNFLGNPIYITEPSILSQANIVILGVDMHKTRKMIYDYCIRNKIWLLDLRAQGTIMSFEVVDGSKSIEYYDQKMFSNPELMERKGGCQLKEDIENDRIQTANKAIAFFGINCILLKHLRGEKPSTLDWKFSY